MLLERTLICACFRYFHEKKYHKKIKKDLWQRPIQPAQSQGNSVLRYAALCALTHSKTDYLRLRQALSVSVAQCWQALWEGPIKNKHRSFARPSVPLAPLHLPSNTLRGPCVCGELWLYPSREGKPTVAHLPRNTSKDREHPCTSGACTRHQKALRHILLWEYISENMKLQARSNMLGTRLKLPQSEDCTHALSADDLD